MSHCLSASRITVQPATEPLTLAELKLHLKVDPDLTEDDDLITRIGESAREYVEEVTRRQLVTATRQQVFSGWGCGLELDRSPVASVTSVTYTDLDGATQTLSPSQYIVQNYREPCRIVPAYQAVWPYLRPVPDNVTVTFVCGYGDVSAVPSRMKEAILLLAGDSYAYRESSVVPRNLAAVDRLLNNTDVGGYP